MLESRQLLTYNDTKHLKLGGCRVTMRLPCVSSPSPARIEPCSSCPPEQGVLFVATPCTYRHVQQHGLPCRRAEYPSSATKLVVIYGSELYRSETLARLGGLIILEESRCFLHPLSGRRRISGWSRSLLFLLETCKLRLVT
jgi:hypothetical protein